MAGKGKKIKKDPVEHEKKYIEFLEGQLAYQMRQQVQDKTQIEKLRYKISKARLVLNLITKK